MNESDPNAPEPSLRLERVLGEPQRFFSLGCTRKPEQFPRTCVLALAGGWVTTQELCSRCTRVFINALTSFLPEGGELKAYVSEEMMRHAGLLPGEQSNQDGQDGP